MARFTIYTATSDIDEHYAPALGYGRQELTAADVGDYILSAYRADSENVPDGYLGAGGRCYNREPNMYLLQTAEDALFEGFSMVGCNGAPRWLEKLCDKCEAALAKEEVEVA